MKTEAQKRAKKKYKQNIKRIAVDFYPTEADLIKQIEKQPQKQTYIKNLIRADMQKNIEKTEFPKQSEHGVILAGDEKNGVVANNDGICFIENGETKLVVK